MQIYHVIIVYVISLALALWLASIVWKGGKRPIFLVFIQAVFEFTGLGMLTWYIGLEATDISASPDLSSIFLGLAAAIVIGMFVVDKVVGRPQPKFLPAAHLGAEVIGIILMILYI
ncbi:hypothetical protein RCC89_07850 [Cytophagaceae bacterium ABcell3]|nr:hypothetical protein RCC89_07850 [Cytophagaceae bacterium ABcell3]